MQVTYNALKGMVMVEPNQCDCIRAATCVTYVFVTALPLPPYKTTVEGMNRVAMCVLPCTKPEDMEYSGWLMEDTKGKVAPLLTKEEAKEH